MNEKMVHDATSDDLLALAKAEPTLKVEIPIYAEDGRTRLLQDGKWVHFSFTLHRPTAAQGLEFGKFRRGELRKKKLKQPSQQEVAIKAVQICLPEFRTSSLEEVLNVLTRTGGYLGDNAKLANACLALLGENFEEQDSDDDVEERWASQEVVPT